MSKQHIEVFTAGCPLCEPVVALVNESVTDKSDVTVHNLYDWREISLTNMKKYNVLAVPAIVVDGKLMECFTSKPITKKDLVNAGIDLI